MHKGRQAVVAIALIVALTIGLIVWYLVGHDLAVFSPMGTVAAQQRQLMMFALTLSLVVVVPVFAMLFYIAWNYGEGNKKARYQPNWANSRAAETVWWGVPLVLIVILSVVTWRSSHDLDPAKALSAGKPMVIQVVALQWKWLFIYPEQGVASVNEVALPQNMPVRFEITADAPMNSFWIPQLGGQIYAMSGMSTELNLIADKVGDYNGVSANISGEGFADMHFKARAMSKADFATWVQQAHNARDELNDDTYTTLAMPSTEKVSYFWSVKPGMYDRVVNKYGGHGAMSGHDHMYMEGM